MSEIFDSSANQLRARLLVMNTMTVVSHPLVDELLDTVGGRNPELGSGSKSYRSGSSVLSNAPSAEGETPAEISYHPAVGSLGLKGNIYMHGEGSNPLRIAGEIVSMCFDDELADGHYTFYMGIYMRPSGLMVGNYDRSTNNITPVYTNVFDTNEAGVEMLLDHLRSM